MALINKLTDIADAIRRKNGETAKYTLPQMVTKIDALKTSGTFCYTQSANKYDLTGDATTVPDNAFQATSSSNPLAYAMRTVDLENVTSVGNHSFYGCSSLQSINLPACTEIGDYAFYQCSDSLKDNVNIPVCKTIGQHAFHGCTYLTSIDLPVCTSVGQSAFSGCTRLTSIDLPVCTSVGQSAFGSCTYLTSIDLPVCTSVGQSVFSSCQFLTSVDLPVCTSVGGGAFQGCTTLVSIKLPACTALKGNTFSKCYSKLDTVDLNVCTSLGTQEFLNCYVFKKLILRNTEKVATLSATNAFDGCSHITGQIHTTYNPEGLKDGYIYVPDALVEDYKVATNWSTYASQIKPLSELPA